MAQTVKHLPAMRETRIRFLDQEDPLEKEMAIHSSTLAWKIPWMEGPDRLQSMGSQESDTTERLHFHFTFNSVILLEEQETQCSHIFGPSVTRGLVRGQTGKPRKVGSGVKADHSHSVGLQVGSLMTKKG